MVCCFARSKSLPDTYSLSGSTDFSLSCVVTTRARAGTIFAKAFQSGLWRGGDQGQGKLLFIRDSKVCFDIGWVGCITGRANVSDGHPHTVALCFSQNQCVRQETSRANASHLTQPFLAGT
jgi:hypothetical protein